MRHRVLRCLVQLAGLLCLKATTVGTASAGFYCPAAGTCNANTCTQASCVLLSPISKTFLHNWQYGNDITTRDACTAWALEPS